MSRHLGFALEGAETRPGGAIKFRVGVLPTDALHLSIRPRGTNPPTDPQASSADKGGRGGLGPGLLEQTARVCSSRLEGTQPILPFWTGLHGSARGTPRAKQRDREA